MQMAFANLSGVLLSENGLVCPDWPRVLGQVVSISGAAGRGEGDKGTCRSQT